MVEKSGTQRLTVYRAARGPQALDPDMCTSNADTLWRRTDRKPDRRPARRLSREAAAGAKGRDGCKPGGKAGQTVLGSPRAVGGEGERNPR